MLGDILIAEPKAVVGFAGRRVIQDTVRETLPEEFQTAEYVRDGNQYDADETSISRMANAIIAAQEEDVTALEWSLADTGTGVMTSVTLADIKEAHKLAVQNMGSIWSIN
jgi:hypothetical protein